MIVLLYALMGLLSSLAVLSFVLTHPEGHGEFDGHSAVGLFAVALAIALLWPVTVLYVIHNNLS